jgi:hypothetical protein
MAKACCYNIGLNYPIVKYFLNAFKKNILISGM